MTQRLCVNCDRPIPKRVGPGRPPEYCSTACRVEAGRQRERHWRVLGQLVEQRARIEED